MQFFIFQTVMTDFMSPMFAVLDTNGDGVLDRNEFAEMFKLADGTYLIFSFFLFYEKLISKFHPNRA